MKHLSEYFDKNKQYTNPYEDNPCDLRAISVEPDSCVLGRSLIKENAKKILDEYTV